MSNPRPKPVARTQPRTPVATKNPPTKASTATRQAIRPSNPPSKPISRPPVPRNPPSTSTKTVSKPHTAAPQKEGNWLNRTVQNSVAGVGNYAGSFINSIGNGINKIGEGAGNQVTSTSRYWGQGVAGYGNNIKDSVGVGGSRVPTGGNPLGLAGQGSSQATRTGAKSLQAVRGKGRVGGSNPLGLSE